MKLTWYKNKRLLKDRKRLFTISQHNKSVYGEKIRKHNGSFIREWNPDRSKLAAAIVNGLSQVPIKPESHVLYLGSASGTSVSHVADMTQLVYAVEFSKQAMRKFLINTSHYNNIAHIIANAHDIQTLKALVEPVDVIFQDIADHFQIEALTKNIDAFLKDSGFAIISVKARSIDVTQSPKKVFNHVEQQLEHLGNIVDKRSLHPFQLDHMLYVIKIIKK